VIRAKIEVVVVVCLLTVGAAAAQDLDSALEQARQLGREHRYDEVIELLSHFLAEEDPEAQYVVAAEIGRARYHLGDYEAANESLKKAVALRPQRAETALYLEATSYLVGERDLAYAIFREIIASGADDLYLAVTLPGERAFLADPKVWEILEELATPVGVDVDRGSLLGVEMGLPRREVERRLGVATAPSGAAITARAGPFLTWVFGFDDAGLLSQIMLHNEHLLRYTPYRIRLLEDLDWRTTPERATEALGAPFSTTGHDDELVVMVWDREFVRLTLEFAPPRTPAPPGVDPARPKLRVVRMEAIDEGSGSIRDSGGGGGGGGEQ
jgi:tetratricopeptide (TPR) repeat protein